MPTERLNGKVRAAISVALPVPEPRSKNTSPSRGETALSTSWKAWGRISPYVVEESCLPMRFFSLWAIS
jgi:hypothetical protein